jgi:hypothetical protein
MDSLECLSVQQVADLLHLSYATVYEKRKAMGFFRLPGSRVWRITRQRLAQLTETNENRPRLSLRVDGENACQSAKIKNPVSTSLTSARQAAKELDVLLKRPTARKLRSITTG